jgi:hypothetical protein
MKRRFWMLAAAVALVAGGALLYSVDPGRVWWAPPCLFHRLTGLYCPGCGTGRALHKLFHADLAGALRLNPLMVVVIPLLVYLVVRSSVRNRPGMRANPASLPFWLPWTILGMMVVYWVSRNIHAYPFTLLAPHK